MKTEEIPRRVAIKALQKMFLAFTGRDLSDNEANRLIEQIRKADW